MGVRLIGANPGLTLFHGALGDDRVAFASVWRVEWSPLGTGDVLIAWHDGIVRLLGANAPLAGWLAREFTRHFPEVAGLPWRTPEVEQVAVEYALDLDTGLRASAGDVAVELADPLDRRPVRIEAFPLGERTFGLSNVYVPCRIGRLVLGGQEVAGVPHVEHNRPSSSAFLAVAEVWTD